MKQAWIKNVFHRMKKKSLTIGKLRLEMSNKYRLEISDNGIEF